MSVTLRIGLWWGDLHAGNHLVAASKRVRELVFRVVLALHWLCEAGQRSRIRCRERRQVRSVGGHFRRDGGGY